MIKKTLLLIAAILSLASQSWATQVLPNGTGSINVAGTGYACIFGPNRENTIVNTQGIAAASGNFTKLRVTQTVAPDNGVGSQSVTFALNIAGTDTALSCTNTEAGFTCSSTGTIAVTAGQKVVLSQVSTNTPAASDYRFVLEFEPTTTDYTLLGGSTSGVDMSRTATGYLAAHGSVAPNTVEGEVQFVVPVAGTLRDLYIAIDADAGTSPNAWDFAVMVNGSPTSITVNIVTGSLTGNDTSNTAAVVAGDLVSIREIPTSSPTSAKANYGLVFVPSTTGLFIIPTSSVGDPPSVSSTEYTEAWGSDNPSDWNTTETSAYSQTTAITVSNIYVSLTTDPDNGGGADSYAFTLMDTTSPTALTCTVADGALTASASGSVSVALDAVIYTKSVPTNTPAASTAARVSYAASVSSAPPAARRIILVT